MEIYRYLPDTLISNTLSISSRTCRRWKKEGFPPYAQERLSLITGEHPSWEQFQIHDGYIITPAGETVTAGQVAIHHWTHDHMISMAAAVTNLEKRLEALTKLRTAVNHEPANYEKLVKKIT